MATVPSCCTPGVTTPKASVAPPTTLQLGSTVADTPKVAVALWAHAGQAATHRAVAHATSRFTP